MKAIKKSSLFFWLCILVLTNKLYSQNQPIDSLEYYRTLYNNPKKEGDDIKALKFFQNKIESLKDDSDQALKSELLILIAQIEKKLGFFTDSENTIVKVLRILPKIKNKDSTVSRHYVSIYNDLGQIYRDNGDYDKALSYYDDAESKSNNLSDSITITNNRGFLYLEQGKYHLAIEKFNKAYVKSLDLDVNGKIQAARALDNLGVAQSKIGDTTALTNLLQALKIRTKIGKKRGVISSYLSLGEYYRTINKDNLANVYANKASKVADSTNNILHRQAVLNLKNDLKGDEDYIALKKINDSIAKSKRASSVKYATYKYSLEESEKEAEKNKKKNVILLFLIGAIIIISISIYFVLKSKHRKKTLQEVFNTEKDISKKVHDEVANDMFQLMTDLQKNPNINEKLIDDLDHIYDKTRNIAKAHSVIDYDGDYETALNDLLYGFSNDEVSIIIKDLSKVNWEKVSKLKREAIYKVLQEFMVNMKKHSNAGIVVVVFKELRKKVLIQYTDDGVGTDLKKNTGLQNVENRIQSIKGSINFESEINNGFKAKITV